MRTCEPETKIIFGTMDLPTVKLHIIGQVCCAKSIKELLLNPMNKNVVMHGTIETPDEFFDSCRVSIVPLCLGTWSKRKISQSLSFGLPVVTTLVRPDGVGLEYNHDVLIGYSEQAVADHVIGLYTNEKLWESISEKGLDIAKKIFFHRSRRRNVGNNTCLTILR
jgi:glycosyltransferase involved in cell wall biosynthesis